MAQKVLLVDDSSTIRSILKVYLMDRGFEFCEAGDGEEALGLLRRTHFDLLVSDVAMPKRDGISLTQEVRADARPFVRRMPIILLTGEGEQSLQKRGLAAGATAFIMKPVNAVTFKAVVNDCLPREKK